ncbi:unnamed protein product [Ectocarpus sp. 8 AP-2014]
MDAVTSALIFRAVPGATNRTRVIFWTTVPQDKELQVMSCVLFSSGVLEFTSSFTQIKKEIERTCVANFSDYYSPWNLSWCAYGCAANNNCGLFKGLPKRVFWRNPLLRPC